MYGKDLYLSCHLCFDFDISYTYTAFLLLKLSLFLLCGRHMPTQATNYRRTVKAGRTHGMGKHTHFISFHLNVFFAICSFKTTAATTAAHNGRHSVELTYTDANL